MKGLVVVFLFLVVVLEGWGFDRPSPLWLEEKLVEEGLVPYDWSSSAFMKDLWWGYQGGGPILNWYPVFEELPDGGDEAWGFRVGSVIRTVPLSGLPVVNPFDRDWELWELQSDGVTWKPLFGGVWIEIQNILNRLDSASVIVTEDAVTAYYTQLVTSSTTEFTFLEDDFALDLELDRVLIADAEGYHLRPDHWDVLGEDRRLTIRSVSPRRWFPAGLYFEVKVGLRGFVVIVFVADLDQQRGLSGHEGWNVVPSAQMRNMGGSRLMGGLQ